MIKSDVLPKIELPTRKNKCPSRKERLEYELQLQAAGLSGLVGGLTCTENQKLARKVIKKLMQDFLAGNKDATPSSAFAVCKMIYDRLEPAKQVSMSLNLTATISPVDLSKYLSPSTPKALPESETVGKILAHTI